MTEEIRSSVALSEVRKPCDPSSPSCYFSLLFDPVFSFRLRRHLFCFTFVNLVGNTIDYEAGQMKFSGIDSRVEFKPVAGSMLPGTDPPSAKMDGEEGKREQLQNFSIAQGASIEM